MTTSDGEGAVQAIQRRCKFRASPIGSEVTTCPRCGVVNQLAGVDVAAKPPREEPRNFGFNWLVCRVPVFWFSGHGKVYFTIGLVLLMILQVHKLLWPAWLLAHVVFGFIGNKIAWQYLDDAESKAGGEGVGTLVEHRRTDRAPSDCFHHCQDACEGGALSFRARRLHPPMHVGGGGY